MNSPEWTALDVRYAATRSSSATSRWMSNLASETPAPARWVAARSASRPDGVGPQLWGVKSSLASSSIASRSCCPKTSAMNRRTTALLDSCWMGAGACSVTMSPVSPIRRDTSVARTCTPRVAGDGQTAAMSGEPIPPVIAALLPDLVEDLRETLGQGLVGVYLYGSAITG